MGNQQVRVGLGVSVISALLALGLVSGAARALPAGATGQPMLTTPVGLPASVLGIRADHAVAPASLNAALAKLYVPSFSRQTKLACSACHYQFPQLTPFGRMFKLNGYTLTSLSTIGQPGDSADSESLKLASIPPVAAMVVAGVTQTSLYQPSKAVPDTSAITPAMVELGRAIFHGQGTCYACHGGKLEGTQIAPTLKQHAWRDAKNGEFAAIYYVATHGVPSTLMVAYPGGITPAQALAVASYVWSVGRGKAKP